MNAIALSDHGSMAATIDFYKAFKNAGKLALNKLGKKKYCIDSQDLNAILKEIPDYSNLYDTIKGNEKLQNFGTQYPELFKEALACAKVKPIIGLEAYEVDDLTIKTKEDIRYHLMLLAKDNEGLEALYKLSSISYIDGFYHRPRLDIQTIAPYAEHLVVMSACLGGRLAKIVGDDKNLNATKDAMDWVAKYKSVFPDFYIEFQNHNTPDQMNVSPRLVELARMTNTPLSCTDDAHFLRPEDMPVQAVFIEVGQSREVGETYNGCYIKSETEVRETLSTHGVPQSAIDEAIQNTNVIANMCNTTIDLNLPNQMPVIKAPDKFENNQAFFKYLVNKGYRERNVEKKSYTKETAMERLRTEYDVLEFQGYIDYFLLLKQLVDEAKKRKIPLGYSRGSGGNCYTLYTLGVTEVDSIRHGLDFARFATKGRKSPADYDMDISKRHRKEMIEIAREQFNISDITLETRVAQIATFNGFSTKVALRDLGKVLNARAVKEQDRIASGEIDDDYIPIYEIYLTLDYTIRDEVAKMIPVIKDVDEFGQEIDKEVALVEAIEDNKKLRDYQRKYPLWFDMVLKLEGLPKSMGTHAAGVVIAPKEIIKYAPLCVNKEKEPMIQYEMHNVLDDLHLVKMDFLGLDTVDVVDDTLKLAGLTWDNVDLGTLDLNDPKVYDNIYKSGHCNGVFQMESSEATKMCVDAQCNTIDDVIAINAANRPGTKEFFPDYIANKLNPEEMVLIHEDLRPVVALTHGVLLYQEQVLNVFRVANFPELEVDTARRAIGKKEAKTMASLREKMFDVTATIKVDSQEIEHKYGLIQRGWNQKQIDDLWDIIQKQASYSFNKGHSTAYGLLSYVTAYLKTYYPLQFMTALLNSESGNYAQLSKYIHECKRMNIEVRMPDINESGEVFSVSGDSILFGIGMIKGLGVAALECIMKSRPYISFEDFLERGHHKVDVTEALIKAGAFNMFSDDKLELLKTLCQWLYQDLQYKPRKDFNNKELQAYGFDLEVFKKGKVYKVPPEEKKLLVDEANALRKIEHDKTNCTRFDVFEKEFNEKYLVGDEADFQMQTLSIYLTINPFQVILDCAELNDKIKPFAEMPDGLGIIIGTIIEVKRKQTKGEGKAFAFTNLLTHCGEMIEATVGSTCYAVCGNLVKKGERVVYIGKRENGRFFVQEMKTVKQWEKEINSQKGR